MRTATHVHLRITMADRCYNMPTRLMPPDEWREYLDFLMTRAGFDRTRPMTVNGTVFDQIYSQELV